MMANDGSGDDDDDGCDDGALESVTRYGLRWCGVVVLVAWPGLWQDEG